MRPYVEFKQVKKVYHMGEVDIEALDAVFVCKLVENLSIVRVRLGLREVVHSTDAAPPPYHRRRL